MASSRKRGRLSSGIAPQSREYYKCVVENCDQSLRGDRITEHFQKNAKLAVLDEAKKLVIPGDLTNALQYCNRMLIYDIMLKNHTKYLLYNSYTSTNLPNWKSHGFKARNEKPLPAAFRNFLTQHNNQEIEANLGIFRCEYCTKTFKIFLIIFLCTYSISKCFLQYRHF